LSSDHLLWLGWVRDVNGLAAPLLEFKSTITEDAFKFTLLVHLAQLVPSQSIKSDLVCLKFIEVELVVGLLGQEHVGHVVDGIDFGV